MEGGTQTRANYSVLVGVVVMIESLGNHRGVVQEVSLDGRRVRVHIKTGSFRGRIILTNGDDVTPLQPPADTDARDGSLGLVKVLDGPLQDRVGVLAMIIEKDASVYTSEENNNDNAATHNTSNADEDGGGAVQVEGVVRFAERDTAVLPLAFLACWRIHR